MLNLRTRSPSVLLAVLAFLVLQACGETQPPPGSLEDPGVAALSVFPETPMPAETPGPAQPLSVPETTPTPAANATGSPLETATPTASPTPDASPTASPTPTPTATATPSPIAVPTATPTPTRTPTPTPIPPSAALSVDVEFGGAPLVVEFSNTSKGAITASEWDFGDDSTSSAQSPTHRYTVAGTYTVQLTVSGPGGTDTSVMVDLVTVQPGPPVSVEISPPSATIAVQENIQFAAGLRDEFGNLVSSTVAWAISEGVGALNANGLLTAGTSTGTFTNGVSASLQTESSRLLGTASVTVEAGPLSSLTVEPYEATLDLGATQRFSFTAMDEFGNKVPGGIASWRVTPDVVTIDSAGLLTAGTEAGVFPGGVLLTVVKDTAVVTTTADFSIRPDPVFSVAIEPAIAIVRPGDTHQFVATGFDFFGNAILGLEFVWEATGGVIERFATGTADFHGGAKGSRYEVMASAQFRDSSRTGTALVGVPPEWMPAGNMEEPRRDHVAVLLDDGNVLIVGGTRSTAELYDPASRTFTPLGSVPFSQGVRATRLPVGRVLVVGESAPGRAVMIYDPATKQFTPTGSLNVARRYSSVTLLASGKVLVAGGQERAPNGGPQSLAVAEQYDPATGDFTVIGSLNEHRSGNVAALLPTGKVLIVGGTQTTEPGRGVLLKTAEIYDPATGGFSVIAETAGTRSLFFSGLVILGGGKVLLPGGTFAEVFDPDTNTFARTPDMGTGHRSHTATLLTDGTVLIAGGVLTTAVELYDPKTGSFTSHSTLPEARQQHTATLLPTGEVLVIGGSVLNADRQGGQDLSSALIYVP